MKDETREWLCYAAENLAVAKLALDAGYFNSAIQNAQQAAEKALKTVLIDHDIVFPKTHRLRQLKGLLASHGQDVPITVEECGAFDSIYMDTRYPSASVLPDFVPDLATTQSFLAVAARVLAVVQKQIEMG